MILCDYHVHTNFSDGENSPEEMVIAAIEKGMTEIGFSDHSYTSFDESCCMAKGRQAEYKAEILRLKEKYAGIISVLCGMEYDYYSDEPIEGFDYIIGSVHYVKVGNEYVTVDDKADNIIEAANNYFDGDVYKIAELYFKTISDVINKTGADIIGHFDVLSKFNDETEMFDESNPRWINAWEQAADKLISSGKIFEINTGGISRGYKTDAYPSKDMRRYIGDKGGRFIFDSDCHCAADLCAGFHADEKCSVNILERLKK